MFDFAEAPSTVGKAHLPFLASPLQKPERTHKLSLHEWDQNSYVGESLFDASEVGFAIFWNLLPLSNGPPICENSCTVALMSCDASSVAGLGLSVEGGRLKVASFGFSAGAARSSHSPNRHGSVPYEGCTGRDICVRIALHGFGRIRTWTRVSNLIQLRYEDANWTQNPWARCMRSPKTCTST